MKAINKWILLFALIFSFSCRTTKLSPRADAPIRTPEQVYNALLSHNVIADWYHYEADVDIESPDINIGGTAIVRIKRDSLIWMVAKKLGIEGIRIQAVPQSVTGILRQDQSYMVKTWAQIYALAGADLNFEDGQEIMCGNIILPQQPEQIQISQNNGIIDISFQDQNIEVVHKVDAYNMKVFSSEYKDGLSRKVSLSFGDYKEVDGLSCSFLRNIVFQDGTQTSKIQLKIKELELNTPKNTPFSIPSHYEKLD